MRIALYVIEKPLDTPGFIGGVFVRVKISLTPADIRYIVVLFANVVIALLKFEKFKNTDKA